MALAHSKGLPLGSSAPRFEGLMGTDGARHGLDDYADAKVLVVVFTCNHCPYAVAYEDRLVALHRDYASKGVQIVAINPNDAERYPDDSLPEMEKRAADKGFEFPYLQDETQEVARAYQAVCTPDPFVFDSDRKLVYAGRIDDSWRDPSAVTTRDLRIALDAVLAGDSVPVEPTPAMGCSIKWKP
ncbi:MAG: thioredoxin family protein [Deltaproteobacteria bacterium]|nr:thioredoxin family protein [Deltaproteobacteria bacterium]